jgi:hypothetical protein
MSDPMFCRRCGSKLKDGSRFCAVCGGSIADDDGAPSATAASSDDELIWRVEVPLLTNRFIMRDTLLGAVATFLIAGTFIGGAFAWGGGASGWRAGFIFAGAFAVFYLVIAVLTFGLIFGNRWPLEFTVGAHGVVMNNISQKAHAIHRFSWILALLTGRPLMAGPGLIAQSREVVGIPWDDVRRVKKYPALGVIYIKAGLLENVHLYCTPSNFAEVTRRVETAVRQHAPSAMIA